MLLEIDNKLSFGLYFINFKNIGTWFEQLILEGLKSPIW